MTRIDLGRRIRLAMSLATALLALSITVTAGTASAATSTFTNSGAVGIPDIGPASPYPSTINVTGLAGPVQKVTATFHNFTHSCPSDFVALLVGPTGAQSVLMGYVGGCHEAGGDPQVNLTFDQAATSGVPEDDYPASGTYKPSASNTITPLAPPAPGAPYLTNLDVFNGTLGNGAWRLFVEDQSSDDEGTIAGGWSVAITAPANAINAGKPKLNKKNGTARIPVTVADAGTLTLNGKGVKSASASKSTAVAGPGTVVLTVKPKGKTARKLNSTGSAAAKVKITFTPIGGTPSVVKKKVKLKKTLG